MTDERFDGAERGANDDPPTSLPDAPRVERPELSTDDSYATSEGGPDRDESFAGELRDLDSTSDADARPSSAAEAEPAATEAPRRPPMPIIIGAVLALLAIGVGLAFVIPSGPIREVDQLIPTTPPAATTDPAAPVPTALPLPEVIEGNADEVIVTVGDGQILRGDFVRFYQPGGSPDELLDQLIQRQLVIQAGLQDGAVIDQAQIDAQLAEIKQNQAGGDDAQFQAFLDQAKIGSEENLKRLLGDDQIIEQMILKHTTAEQVRARHILLSTENISDTASIKSEAEALIEQLDSGADFAALAQERSADPGSAANGGDLGWAMRGMYVPEFDEAVFSMQVGERRLVETQFGFHIIEVLEPASVRTIASSELLQTPAGQQAFSETFLPWVDQLRSDADAAKTINIIVPASQLVAIPPTQ